MSQAAKKQAFTNKEKSDLNLNMFRILLVSLLVPLMIFLIVLNIISLLVIHNFEDEMQKRA